MSRVAIYEEKSSPVCPVEYVLRWFQGVICCLKWHEEKIEWLAEEARAAAGEVTVALKIGIGKSS